MNKKRILICPLDWGLGHATRCIPVIRELLSQDFEVLIGADRGPLALLRNEFPELDHITLSGYNISYPENGQMAVHMAKQTPAILAGIKKEHNALNTIIAEKKIDAVISDHRFGLYHKNIPCIFITHQIMVKSPILEGLIHRLNNRYIKKFDSCWVPDFETDNNLSGDLAHKYPLPDNASFIGPLTRFTPQKRSVPGKYDVMFVISGPEPQRTKFENLIMNQLDGTKLKVLVVRGRAESDSSEKKDTVEIYAHLSAKDMQEAILDSDLIVSRSGYSTIMDLAVLGKKAIFVPTPGQTEQEYLADYHRKKKHYYSVPQSEFTLARAIKESVGYSGIKTTPNTTLLKGAIRQLLNIIKK